MLKRISRGSRMGSKTQPLMAGAGRDLDILLRYSAAVLLALTILSLVQFLSGTSQALLYATIEGGALFATAGLWRLNLQGKTALSGYLFIAILLAFLTFGIEPAWLLTGPLLSAYVLPIGIAGLLFGPRAGFGVCIAVTGLVVLRAVMGTALQPGLTLDPLQIALSLLALYFLAVIDWRSARNLLQALGVAQHSVKEARALGDQLEEYASQLEESQNQLARRARYLEAAAQIAAAAVATHDPQQLLEPTAQLISQRFGFCHTSIFLVDDRHEWAVLRAASSAGGQRMLTDGYRLPLGQDNLVGYVAARGISQTVFDVKLDPGYADNPDLRDTRSMAALPLRARGTIIGVLEVHSTEPAAFNEEDVGVLQTLADQIAMAISNAQYHQESEETLAALQRAYGQISREAWLRLLREQPHLGFRRDRLGVAPLAASSAPTTTTPNTGTDLDPEKYDGRPEEAPLDSRPEGAPQDEVVLIRPVQVRDQVVGVINARKPPEAGRWTSEETSLLEALIGQLEVAFEDARLYRASQRHAHFERLTRQITAKVHANPEIPVIAQTSITELVEALSSTRGFIQLDVEALDSTAYPADSTGEAHRTNEHDPTTSGPDARRRSQILCYEHSLSGVVYNERQPLPEIDEVLNQGATTVTSGEDDRVATLITPIRLRDRVIGVLGLQDTHIQRSWSEDEIALVEATADQAAQALEVAHLLDKTQRLARREQLVTEITGKIRSARDIDGILRTAVQEMQRALGVSHGLIRLGTENHLRPPETPRAPGEKHDLRDTGGSSDE
jgi:GAF domain-containing protein